MLVKLTTLRSVTLTGLEVKRRKFCVKIEFESKDELHGRNLEVCSDALQVFEFAVDLDINVLSNF